MQLRFQIMRAAGLSSVYCFFYFYVFSERPSPLQPERGDEKRDGPLVLRSAFFFHLPFPL